MTTKRYDVMSPRKRQEKTYWQRVGTAWESEKGINITFDALPLPDEKGEVRVSLFEPRPKDGDIKPPMGNAPQKPRQNNDDMDGDQIPF